MTLDVNIGNTTNTAAASSQDTINQMQENNKIQMQLAKVSSDGQLTTMLCTTQEHNAENLKQLASEGSRPQ
ncbi:hypothetical protein GJQ57_03130 [Ralstonia pickettii]|uniref:Uncharacterized protein n=1 Tax=Ralstonia pickettii TaxID=329 RepID=A0A7X2L967_RALPI|nr:MULTISPECIES: hypothetical protein [Ralstonia]MRS97641.1 hypothetical protein [Ralstonia pickettii]OCS49740.1 hypothetical protein BEK67_18025 [Ralstonia pickettii]CAJ0771209.1 hypothetical protein R8510_01382 [Ralstonia chuxiongensis]